MDYLNFHFLGQLNLTSGNSSSPPLLSALVSLPPSSASSSLTPSPLPNSIRSPSSLLSFISPEDSSLPPKPKLLVSIAAARQFIARCRQDNDLIPNLPGYGVLGEG